MATHDELTRRDLVRAAATGGLVVCGSLLAGAAASQERTASLSNGQAEEVGAAEDLMREHGVLRRTLIVYREAAARLRSQQGRIDAAALGSGAELFRRFGEEYHERILEEQHVFPMVLKLQGGGDLAKLVDTLVRQHMRGREITDYILSVTHNGRIAPAEAEPLAMAMETMARMYEAHAAREDTVLFPAWRNDLSADRFEELSAQFEEIEHREFGQDGFKDAVQRISGVEQMLGIDDLADFTAPAPPTAQA